MNVLPALLPFRKGFFAELNHLPVGLIIEIEIEVILVVVPFTVEQFTFVPIHDVALEGEAQVGLLACAPKLPLLAESEDVVPNDVLSTIVLMKPAILGAIDQVILDHNLATAFVGVNSPPSIIVARHIMAEVVPLEG